MSKIWFITGANRGFGREIAQAALAAGDRVVATGRNVDALKTAYADHGELCCASCWTSAALNRCCPRGRAGRCPPGPHRRWPTTPCYGQLGLFEGRNQRQPISSASSGHRNVLRPDVQSSRGAAGDALVSATGTS